MSLFKNKIVNAEIRGDVFQFNVISQKDVRNLKFYGKLSPKIAEEMETAELDDFKEKASIEINSLLCSKIVNKDDEKPATPEEFEILSPSEIEDLLKKLSGSQTKKK